MQYHIGCIPDYTYIYIAPGNALFRKLTALSAFFSIRVSGDEGWFKRKEKILLYKVFLYREIFSFLLTK